MTTDGRQITLQEGAMRAGTAMGLFWIIKFSMIHLGFYIPVLHLFFIFLTLCVPFLGYIYTKRYRNRYREGVMTYGQGFAFSLMMYVSATMLAFIGHYVYFRYLENGFLIEAYSQQLELAKSMLEENDDMTELFEQSAKAFDELSTLSPVQKTFRMAWQNLTFSVPLAAITGVFTRKLRKNNNL